MSSELAALDELKGRCLAIQVAYLDTGVRMNPAIEKFTKYLGEASKRPLLQNELDDLTEEIGSLREYFRSMIKDYPEVKREFLPAIRVCDYLIEPID